MIARQPIAARAIAAGRGVLRLSGETRVAAATATALIPGDCRLAVPAGEPKPALHARGGAMRSIPQERDALRAR